MLLALLAVIVVFALVLSKARYSAMIEQLLTPAHRAEARAVTPSTLEADAGPGRHEGR